MCPAEVGRCAGQWGHQGSDIARRPFQAHKPTIDTGAKCTSRSVTDLQSRLKKGAEAQHAMLVAVQHGGQTND